MSIHDMHMIFGVFQLKVPLLFGGYTPTGFHVITREITTTKNMFTLKFLGECRWGDAESAVISHP